ncbi:MAG: SIS domain-containing protein [Dehalococcoidia bacterium]|nr:SIS domain-containing protein [Dehalococcoidia bacterium]
MTRAIDFVTEARLSLLGAQWTPAQRHDLALINLVDRLRQQTGDVLLVGNGGLLAVAEHIAVDLWTQADVRALAITSPVEITAAANDYGFDASLARPVERLARQASLLIALSASGRSPNVLEAVAAARRHGLGVVTFSAGAEDNPLRALGDLNCYVPAESVGVAQVVIHALLHAVCEELSTEKQVG